MPRIALDLWPICLRMSGIGIYVQQLLAALLAEPGVDCEWAFPLHSSYFFRRLAVERIGSRLPNHPFAIDHWWRPGAEVTALHWPLRLSSTRRRRYDLFHATNVQVRYQSDRIPLVVTAHDIAWMRLPPDVCPTPPLKSLSRYLDILRQARLILCVSETTRRDVHEIVKVPEDRLLLTPLAARGNFRPPDEESARGDARRLLAGGRPYFLALGTIEPRKNFPRLVRAVARLRQSGCEHRLMIVGRKAWDWPAVREAIESERLGDAVQVVGYVDDARLLEYLWGAEALVMPSLYEGFGLPVLEAMACGTPVVAGRAGSLPEVAGDAAVLVDPLDVESIADGLQRVADQPQETVRLRQRGYARTGCFSWQQTARLTWEGYERAME